MLIDNIDEYLRSVAGRYARKAPEGRGKALIISGSFPDGLSPMHAQILTTAVHVFAQAVLDTRASIIFGSHPTFLPLILAMARRRRPHDFVQATRLYVSRHYVSQDEVEHFERSATVFPTDRLSSDGESLTLMREAMIADEQAVGLVAMGGMPPRPTHRAGVYDEVDIACGRQLMRHQMRHGKVPVFLIGAPGGQAAARAAEESGAAWVRGLNPLTPEQTEELRAYLSR